MRDAGSYLCKIYLVRDGTGKYAIFVCSQENYHVGLLLNFKSLHEPNEVRTQLLL